VGLRLSTTIHDLKPQALPAAAWSAATDRPDKVSFISSPVGLVGNVKTVRLAGTTAWSAKTSAWRAMGHPAEPRTCRARLHLCQTSAARHCDSPISTQQEGTAVHMGIRGSILPPGEKGMMPVAYVTRRIHIDVHGLCFALREKITKKIIRHSPLSCFFSPLGQTKFALFVHLVFVTISRRSGQTLICPGKGKHKGSTPMRKSRSCRFIQVARGSVLVAPSPVCSSG